MYRAFGLACAREKEYSLLSAMKKERVLYFFGSFFGSWLLASLWRQFRTGSIVNFVKDHEKMKFMDSKGHDVF